MQFVCFKELSENTKYNVNLKERNSRENKYYVREKKIDEDTIEKNSKI